MFSQSVHAYMGGFESQDGYLPFLNNTNTYNAGQFGTNNGGPGGSSATLPVNTGLWSRLDPVGPGTSYVTGHMWYDRTWVNSAGTSGSTNDMALVLTTNHMGWNAGALNYRYNMDNRDYNGSSVASSANSVVNLSFWWCAQLDPNVGNGYFGDEISFYDSANKLAFRLGLTERASGDKVTFWNGTTMFESTLVGPQSRYDRWDLSFNYVAKTVTAKYFAFNTSTLHTLCTNVPMMDVTANGLTHWEFRTSPGTTNAKLMSIDDVTMEIEADPNDCMEISNGYINCVPNSTGGYTYTYNFAITNLSGHFVHTALIPAVATVPTDGSVTLSPNVIPVNMPHGTFVNASITINGAQPGQEVCFDIGLFNVLEGVCCSEEVCLKMPCVKLSQSIIVCNPNVPGSANWGFTMLNTSGGTIHWAEIIPQTPGVQVTPGQISLGNLANNTSTAVGPLQISGAAPNTKVCFTIVVFDAEMRRCCFQDYCIMMPDCGQPQGELPPLPTAVKAEPCKPTDNGAIVSPDGCLVICDEKIICDPQVPAGSAPCVLYTFTVTNVSAFPITHLVFPSANVTPSQLFFNPPINPGQAVTATVQICNQAAGPFSFPIMALDLAKCRCCSIVRDITLPNCDCLQVTKSTLKCTGVDANGTFCYQWDATIQNLESWVADHAFLLPDVPANVTFSPQYFNIPPMGQYASTNLSTVIKAPGNPSSITFYITIHNADMSECCAIPYTLVLPPCCDCDKLFNFADGGHNPAGGQGLPAGISLLNLEMDATGKIGFPATPKPFPYVYMAASGRGTIVRIDANTGTVLGEYRTVPQSRGANHNPSRTTVDRFGECWVGNRNDAFPLSGNLTGSVMRVGLIMGGTRGNKVPKPGGGWMVSPSATGEYLEGPFAYMSPSVSDRDGDGLIRTSYGLGNILNWDAASVGSNNLGGVSLADDECIVTYTRTKAVGVRALAIDANNDLWVGGYPNQNVYGRISGASGLADWSTTGLNPGVRNIGGGYGALIDSNNVLWSVSREGSSSTYGVYRHVIATNTTTFISAEGNYGIGIDLCSNSIWVSSVFPSNETRSGFNISNQYVLRRFNAAGTLTGAYIQPRPAQGLSVDSNGHPFVSGVYYNPGEVWHFNQTGVLLATITGTNGGSTGTAVDHNGKIWVSDYTGNQALRMNPVSNTQEVATSLGAGATPYNYSDMTGYVALNAAGQFGMLQYMQDSRCPDTDWGKVSWTSLGEVQKSCTITVQVRASNNPLVFPSTWTSVGNGMNFCGRGIKGQYLQVRVIFRRPAGCPPECNPRLCTLRIQCCDKTLPDFASDAPDVSLPDVIHVRDGNSVLVRAYVSDPDGDSLTGVFRSGTNEWTRPAVDGAITLQAELDPQLVAAGKGEQAFSLAVSDGLNVVNQEFSVVYGDQAPVVSAPAARSVKALRVMMPDLRDEVVAYDDFTAVENLTIVQTPAPGTPMLQGGYQVHIAVSDSAGNVGHAETYFEVASAVSVGGIVNYQVIPNQGSFTPTLLADVPVAQIASSQLIVDNAVFRSAQGVMPPQPVVLPPGHHKVSFRIFDAEGASSESRPLVVFVLGSQSDPYGMALTGPMPVMAFNPAGAEPGEFVIQVTLEAGKTFNLMRSTNLKDWTQVQVLVGTGELVTVPVELTAGATSEYFRLERPAPPSGQ